MKYNIRKKQVKETLKTNIKSILIVAWLVAPIAQHQLLSCTFLQDVHLLSVTGLIAHDSQ